MKKILLSASAIAIFVLCFSLSNMSGERAQGATTFEPGFSFMAVLLVAVLLKRLKPKPIHLRK